MQETHTPISVPDDTKHVPLHNDIAQCAQELWLQYGKPTDRDLAIWLEAEHKLFSATQISHRKENDVDPVSSSGRKRVKAARS
jgi:hypothetical protein